MEIVFYHEWCKIPYSTKIVSHSEISDTFNLDP